MPDLSRFSKALMDEMTEGKVTEFLKDEGSKPAPRYNRDYDPIYPQFSWAPYIPLAVAVVIAILMGVLL